MRTDLILLRFMVWWTFQLLISIPKIFILKLKTFPACIIADLFLNFLWVQQNDNKNILYKIIFLRHKKETKGVKKV